MDLDVKELEKSWKSLIKQLNQTFDADLDIQGVLFLIGVQVLGQGPKKFKKDDKLALMHIAICSLLEPYGYYVFKGADADGYPHWEVKESLPFLNSGQQLALMKTAIIEYFEKEGLFEIKN
jgi:hypothetical protein